MVPKQKSTKVELIIAIGFVWALFAFMLILLVYIFGVVAVVTGFALVALMNMVKGIFKSGKDFYQKEKSPN